MIANGEGAVESMPPPPPPPTADLSADPRGKHRILAELKRLEQEARFIQKELEELEKTDKVSAALQGLLLKVENNADPLLPITHGPTNPNWDRWFEGPQDLGRCKCWIL